MKLARHLAGYLPARLAGGIAAFGGVYVFTRLLGAEDYGRYALMLSLVSLVHTITLTGAEAAAYRFSARGEVTPETVIRNALSITWRALCVTGLIMAVLAFAFRNSPAYLALLPWIIVLMPLNTVVQMSLELHRAGQRVARFAFVESFRLLGGFAAGALIAWQTGAGAAAPFIGLVIAVGLMALKEGIWLLRSASKGTLDPAQRRAFLAYGLPIAAALTLDIMLSAGDRFLIAWFLGEASVGAYAAGYGVADKTVLLICAWATTAGSPLVMAAFEEGGAEAAAKEARGLITAILFVAMPAATGLALVADPLAEAMIGPELRVQAATIIPWIAFAGLFNGLLVHYFAEPYMLARRTGLRAALMLVPAGLNLALNLILIPQFGLMGAVFATLASYMIGAAVLAWRARPLVAFPIPPGQTVRIALACLAMWPVIALVPDWGGWLELFTKAGAGALTYGVFAIALNAGGARRFVQDRFAQTGTTRTA